MKTKKTGPLVLLGLLIGCVLILAGCPSPSAGYGTSQDELTGNVSITGTRQVGHQLTANTANLGGSGTISFQWRRGATDILGATGNTYIVQVADAGYVITVRVTRANNSGSVTSIGTVPAVPTPPAHAIVPTQPANQIHTFPPLPPGFPAGDRTAHTVTIRNGGYQPTGPLTVTLSGDYAVSFSLSTPTSLSAASLSTTRIAATASVSTITIPTIAVNGSGAFTVIPNTGLAAGTHTATVTITGANLTAQSFTVSFEVTAASIPGISLDPPGNHTFATLPPGFFTGDRTPHTVTVNNTGNQPTGQLTLALSGTHADSFALSPSTITNIAVDGSTTFTVLPTPLLAAGTYNATVTVSGTNITPQSFNVTLVVAVLPELTGTVTIDGNPHVGETLTANIDNLDGTGTVTFAWRRDGSEITLPSAETGPTYLVRSGDIDQNISVRVWRAGYYGSLISIIPLTIVNPPDPYWPGSVTIDGVPQVGQTLTASISDFPPAGGTTFQWFRGNQVVANNNILNPSYQVQLADLDKYIRVIVTRSGISHDYQVGPVTAASCGGDCGCSSNDCSLTSCDCYS